MLRRNVQIFLLFFLVALLLIFFKAGRFFDFGVLMRLLPQPQKTVNQLLNPPDNLESSYQELLSQNTRLQALAQENDSLRALLNLKAKANYDLKVANILSRDLLNQNLLVIDVGESDGAVPGQAVVVNDGVIIGKIIEVRADASVVRLLTDGLSKVAVNIGDSQNVAGVLTGLLGLGMNLSYIPQEQVINKGDLVLTSGLNEKIPAGLVIGKVEEVKFSQEELFKQATVSPLLDYSTLFLVAVIVSL
jgi:rod shape-determining protein MreC